ncbi:MAG: type II secretion system secretin GspD [Gammaproteobacteria bacterium]|nr:type II secretion system secretin GspD [Gammaproteobacteria bacterium]MBU1414868.1 type II secretion system secretin GspD [Gammaproteobacteria bacterium]
MTGICRIFRIVSIALLLAGSAAWAQEAEEGVSLTFANADIETVIRAIGKISNRNILIDPRVKGTLNIVTSKPVTPDVAYQILLSALRLQGYAVIEEEGIIKVVPEAEGKTHSVPVVGRSKGQLRGERLVTHVFHIKNESAVQLLTVVKPLVSPSNSVTAYASNNTLIVTDYADNVSRIAKIIDALDMPQGDIVVIPLKHTAAQDIAPLVSKLMSESAGGAPQAADPSQRVTVAADSRLNALLVRSENPSRINSIRQLVSTMDQPGLGGNIHVIYLKNADATKVAQTLGGVLSGQPVSTATGGGSSGLSSSTPAQGQQQASAPSTAGSSGHQMVQADRSTNSLIITAPEAVYNNIRSVVDQLDRRRAQVYVEALIAEVTADNASEVGIQFQNSNFGTGGAAAFGGTNFSSGTSNILGLAANPLGAAGGMNLAVAKGWITIGSGDNATQILNLGMLARFLETQTNTNILSTPNLLMLDNEEAKIVVGQNVPFVTGQYTNTGSGSTVANPFQTIERKDVGLTLKVKPQISEGGALILQIFQESSSVVATSTASSTGPTTNKRSIETTAVVDDGEIIVLGGLVEDTYSNGAEKVPVLGDIPILGHLFRYDTRVRKKTNLFVFLRPTILRDGASYKAMTTDRYRYIVGQQRGLGKAGQPVKPEPESPELPPLIEQPSPPPVEASELPPLIEQQTPPADAPAPTQ